MTQPTSSGSITISARLTSQAEFSEVSKRLAHGEFAAEFRGYSYRIIGLPYLLFAATTAKLATGGEPNDR
jgi:hypothetical protein